MKAAGERARRSIRVLSPRIEPPERAEDGSTASTATFRPCSTSMVPKASMKVDLPTPGEPESPTRIAPDSPWPMICSSCLVAAR